MKEYKYVVVGGGICGASVAYELSKTKKSVLLVDKHEDVAKGASGAAGAFLSPLLGKPNKLKELVTKSLIYSTNFYKENFPKYISNCGTVRIPKDREDEKKFESYIPYMDFEYTKKENGYFFPIGSVVKTYEVCKSMIQKVDTVFNYEVKTIEEKDEKWLINGEILATHLILTTGHENSFFNEFYCKIRAVWGRRINIETTTNIYQNYHKACSVSVSKESENGKFEVAIGATHHRDEKGVLDIEKNHLDLLSKAQDIVKLEDIKIIKDFAGARACSVDYLPIVGSVINSEQTLKEFPHMKHGTYVPAKRLTRYTNLYMLNGMGGRGFVLAPYLAKLLIENIINKKELDTHLTIDRLFIRESKKL